MVMPTRVPEYTVDDVYRLSKRSSSLRYEVLRGKLLVTPAPSHMHGAIVARLTTALMTSIPEHVGRVVTPGEIVIGKHTLIDPDILVIPGSYPIVTPWRDIQGWPLAVEVASPSSRNYDRNEKRAAYLALGVQEYWIVDPVELVVEVWRPSMPQAERCTTTVTWRALNGSAAAHVDLRALFRGLSGAIAED